MNLNFEKEQSRHALVWLATVALSLIFVLIFSRLATAKLDIFNDTEGFAVKARVLSIGDLDASVYETEAVTYENYTQYFQAEVLTKGRFQGQILEASQASDNFSTMTQEKAVSVGDKVMLYNYGGDANGENEWVFGGYARLDGVMILVWAFALLLILLGGIKGLNTIVSLALTCLVVFTVFVPSVMAGWNIYLMTALTCVYTIVMTLFITNGISQKSCTTILGCCFGVIVAAILSFTFDRLLRLTGMLDEHSVYLKQLTSGVSIDLNGVIFAMIVIGAMGAVMDVAMDISSSLYEVHLHAPDIDFYGLFRSGMNIGRDVMGTMANTLVLAYIGSALCSILLYITYSSSLLELLNRENIVVEILQSVTGSLAILLTIPLTTLVCCFVYTDAGSIRFLKEDIKKERIEKRSQSRRARKKAASQKGRRQTSSAEQNQPTSAQRSIIPEKEPIDLYEKEIRLK
ncbi:MAG: YibE/F family protein [Firmicutes bacterium]|nr:YibE/F family protein [Bacillota bacterium]